MLRHLLSTAKLASGKEELDVGSFWVYWDDHVGFVLYFIHTVYDIDFRVDPTLHP